MTKELLISKLKETISHIEASMHNETIWELPMATGTLRALIETLEKEK